MLSDVYMRIVKDRCLEYKDKCIPLVKSAALYIANHMTDDEFKTLQNSDIDKARDPDSTITKLTKYFPSFQSHPCHQACIIIISIIMGIEAGLVSETIPSIGLTGSFGTFWLLSSWDWLSEATIVHDVLETFKMLGVAAPERRVFGVTQTQVSAVIAVFKFLVKNPLNAYKNDNFVHVDQNSSLVIDL